MQYDRDAEYRIVEPKYTVSYSTGPYGPYPSRRTPLTSIAEVRDVIAAVTALTVAFFVLIYRSNRHGFLYYLGIAAIVVVAAFLIHEMSHKLVARRYGHWAEFRANYGMLGLMLVMAFFGFLFAAPGAVMIVGNVNREQSGKISLAGPGSNIVISAASLPLALVATSGLPDFVHAVSAYLCFFSGFLGAFNMIPVMPFDGAKIWHWDKAIYVVALLAAGVLAVLGFSAFTSL